MKLSLVGIVVKIVYLVTYKMFVIMFPFLPSGNKHQAETVH